MIRRRFLIAASGWFVSSAVLSGSKVFAGPSDPRFSSTITSRIDGKSVKLALTGSALRKKYGFSVYTVASYMVEGTKVRDAEELAKADIAKQLHLIFERDVDGQSIATSFRGSIATNHPAPAFKNELAKLEQYFLAHSAKQNDHLWLTNIPGVGLGCQFSGQPGVVIDGVSFSQAIWRTYLGPNSISVAITEGLTSRIR